MEEAISKKIIENPDSIEFSTPSKGGAVKIYGDYSKPEEFKKKIDNAKKLRDYTNTIMERPIAV